MVAHAFFLFERAVVFFVDAHEREAVDGREQRRACADCDAERSVPKRGPHRVPLAVDEAAVNDGDRLAEPRGEPLHELRRERDLGNQHDRAAARF
jgi:hypothetical protein